MNQEGDGGRRKDKVRNNTWKVVTENGAEGKDIGSLQIHIRHALL